MLNNKIVYLDNNATTKTDEKVVEVMLPYFSEKYGNPSSMYELGAENSRAIKAARETMKRRLALIDYQKEMWGKRPLAKLTHDIMLEIDTREREDKQEKDTTPL